MVRELTLFWLFLVQPGEIQWDACQVVVGRKPSEDTWAISLREDVSITFYIRYFYHHRNISVHRALTSCHQVCSLLAQQWLWAARTVCIACVVWQDWQWPSRLIFFLFFLCLTFARRFMWEKNWEIVPFYINHKLLFWKTKLDWWLHDNHWIDAW